MGEFSLRDSLSPLQNAANRGAAAAAAAASRPTSAVADHLTWSDPYGTTASACSNASAAAAGASAGAATGSGGSAAAATGAGGAPRHSDLVKMQRQLDEQCAAMGLAADMACGIHAGVYELYQQIAANKLKLGEVRSQQASYQAYHQSSKLNDAD